MQFLSSLSLLASLAFAATSVVEMSGLKFLQPDITIKVGDVVTWKFESKAHSVTQVADAKTCTPLKGGFDTGSVKSVDVSKTFTEAGTFYYVCNVGPHCNLGMRGVVTVV